MEMKKTTSTGSNKEVIEIKSLKEYDVIIK